MVQTLPVALDQRNDFKSASLRIKMNRGQTDFAQALWRVKADRGIAGFAEFARKFRVYDIGDQDRIAEWIRSEFPGMLYILSQAPEGRDKRLATFRGMYLTGDETLTRLCSCEP